MSKHKFDLSVEKGHKLFPPVAHMPVVKGIGTADYQFPSDLTERTLRKVRKQRLPKNAARAPRGESFLRPDLGSIFGTIKPSIAHIPDAEFTAVVNAAGAVQRDMINRQFDNVMDMFFGTMEGAANWARTGMPAAHQNWIADHQRQVASLRSQVETALPKVLSALVKRNPGVPMGQLMQHAVQMIWQQLQPIVQVLSIYTDALGQYRDGRWLRQLSAANQYMTAVYNLYLTGDVKGNKPVIPTSSLTVGDLQLVGFGGGGLGTIPGAKGPLHVNLLMVPFDMQDWLAVPGTPLLGHEAEHQIFADVPGLEQELKRVLSAAVNKAISAKTLGLTSRFTAVGDDQVPTHELIIKMFADTIGEIDADFCSILLHGPAFMDAMLISFPALSTRDGLVKDAKELLRTSSVYMMEPQDDGSVALEFEPHPQDYIRAWLDAAVLEELGFKAKADLYRRLTDTMVGEVPQFLTWEDAEGKDPTVIKIAVADIKAVASVVAKALIRTPLASLNNKSRTQIVWWDDARQKKVDALVAVLRAGGNTLPTDIGDIFENYIGAAGSTALALESQEKDAAKFLPALQDNVYTMLEALRAKS